MACNDESNVVLGRNGRAEGRNTDRMRLDRNRGLKRCGIRRRMRRESWGCLEGSLNAFFNRVGRDILGGLVFVGTICDKDMLQGERSIIVILT